MQSKEDERKQAPWKCGNEKCNYLRSRSITSYFREHLPSLKVQFPRGNNIPNLCWWNTWMYFWRKILRNLSEERLPWPNQEEYVRPCSSLWHQPHVSEAVLRSHISPEKTFFYGKYIRMCPNLGCCFMQGGEFPEVRYVYSCAMLHQQLSDLKHIYNYVLLCRIWYYFLPIDKAKQVRSAIIVCGTTCPILMCFPCYFHDLVVIDNVPHNVHMSRHCEEVPARPG